MRLDKKSQLAVPVFGFLTAALFLSMNPSFAAEEASPAKTDKVLPKEAALDTNSDEKPDNWQYFENGKIVKSEADTNFDGKIDQWAFYENDKIVKVEKDSNFDGKVDGWVKY